MAWQARLGGIWPGQARYGVAWQARVGTARQSEARQDRQGNIKEKAMIYQFDEAFGYKGDGQVVGKMLETVRVKNGGMLTSASVVSAAKPKKSVLHSYFEWNDAEAARQHRLTQAARLVRAVVVCPDEDTDEDFAPIRAFVAVNGGRRHGYQFMSVVEAMQEPGSRARVLDDARRDLAAWRRKYANLKAFAELYPAIDQVLNA